MPVNIGKTQTEAPTSKTKGLDALLAASKEAEALNEPITVTAEASANAAQKLADAVKIPDEDETPAVAPEPKSGEFVDELAELMAWEAEQKKDVRYKRLTELKAQFAMVADAVDDDEVVTFEGNTHVYQLGKKSTVRSIEPTQGKAKIIEIIGAEQFLELASVKLSDIDAYLTPPQKELVLVSERGGRSGKMLDKN